MKPRIRILEDDGRWMYCGLFKGGYSGIAFVGYCSLKQVIDFYCRVVKYET